MMESIVSGNKRNETREYVKIAKLDQMLADVDFFTSVIGRPFISGLRAEIVDLKEEIEREDI